MTTISCPTCGQAVDPATRFCPECGAKIHGTADRPKSTGLRDTLIIVAALVVVAAAYFMLRQPTPRPESPAQQTATQPGSTAQHPPITDPSGQTMDMPILNNLPTDYAGLVNSGNDNMDHKNYPVAAECYRRALALDGSSADVRTDYGACLHGMGLPQRAIEEFRKVLAQDTKHTICNFNLGIVFNELKQTDSAKYYWKKYLELDPNGKASDAARQSLKEIGG